MNNLLSNRYFRFSIAAIIYLLIIIWIGNYWLLIGLAVLFDIYVSEKVNWTFWKKKNGKNSAFVEWLDALIFAVIAVSLINIFLFQNYRIPTPSMEKSLLVGEHNALRVDGSTIYINNEPATDYTFKMNYYWMMGDNLHNSADSRYWGFVPEDHVVGKPKFIWLSINKEAQGLKKIRFGRMFMKAR